jgi:hypothetical protein
MTQSEAKTDHYILLALLALMAATRSHHFASITHLPDASWAVFFLAGFYLNRWIAFAGLLVLAAAIDYVAIQWFGVSDFCISAAYPALILAYGALWLAGRWYAGRHRLQWNTLSALTIAVLAGSVACEVLSGGSFYFLSGRTADLSLAGYGAQFLQFYPADLTGMSFYLAVAALVNVAIVFVSGPRGRIAVR